MSKRLLIAAMLVALMALPASAAVQSVKVSGSLESTWVVRDQFDLGDVSSASDSEFYQNLLITQAIVRFDADLTDNVSVVTQLINERAWDEEVSSNTDIDINLAYIEMREFLNSNLTVTVGRQVLNYGNAFIIGAGGPNNRIGAGGLNGVAEDLSWRTEYDAVKMVLDYDPLVVDIFAAKVDANQLTGVSSANTSEDDVDLYGINANWNLGDERNTGIEGYFFAKINQEDLTGMPTGQKADTVYVPGMRIYSNPIEGMYTSVEVAWQRGNNASVGDNNGADNLKREAMGAQVIGSYAIPGDTLSQYSPVLSGSYTYVSGDSNPDDERDPNAPASQEKWTAWDDMFEDQSGGTIYNTLFDLTNSHIYNAGLQMTPMEDVIAKISWWGIWLDKEMDEADSDSTTSDFIMRQPDGTTTTPVVSLDETHVGNELDVDLVFNYTEDVQLGFSAGWFFPGDVFSEDNDDVAKQFLTKVGVNW